ncbi:hypothetical protein FKE98_08450 [Corynebacterium aurimucosum]|uniref:hypothetical protein n=1 Tax=Corynebacterium guaraldiae TaxID=3051103 RepID=UPI0012B90DE1|nr:hypothetical protein [Corynebacterium guaraldiae]MTE10439.1 hypothetical protein [Corynebacterium guaraldiae]
MATLEELQQQAKNAQRRLNNARKRADENLGKRLREILAGEDKLSREAQDERAHAFIDEHFAQEIIEQRQRAERKKQEREEKKKAKEAEADNDEERQERDEGNDGQGCEGDTQHF